MYVKNQTMPARVLTVAVELFAGQATGFSGPQIVAFFAPHSDLVMAYPWRDSPSRKVMFETCLTYFPPDVQRQLLLELCDYDGPMAHGAPADDDRQRLRNLLAGASVPTAPLARPVNQSLRWDAVDAEWRRIARDIDADPEGAITAVRSLVETVCKHVLDERSVAYGKDEKLPKLAHMTASALNLAPEQHVEQVIKQILGGCAAIVQGMAGLRNNLGDAHGKGKSYRAPGPRHAKLAVSVGGGLATFLMETHQASKTP